MNLMWIVQRICWYNFIFRIVNICDNIDLNRYMSHPMIYVLYQYQNLSENLFLLLSIIIQTVFLFSTVIRIIICVEFTRVFQFKWEFNLILHAKLRGKTHNYAEFNEAILTSGEETAMILRIKCQGWYHHSRDTLNPVLDARNKVLYHMRAHKPAPSRQTLDELRQLQWEVEEVIAMAKTRWSRHLAEVIHDMNFRPKEAWANIRLLSKGERSHHSATSTIQLRMPSGELATTDEENARVFSAELYL